MTTAVLDIGKTNLKLALVDDTGAIVAARSRANASKPGPPWQQLDLAGLEAWLLEGLAEFAGERALDAFVAVSHGSAGVLIDDDGPVLPAIDYEAQPPADLLDDYARIVPPFPERGSALLGGASHFARQLLWMQRAFPAEFARARHFLALPQYVAWRLTGEPAWEWTMLGAQSHLWSPLRGDLTELAETLGVRHLFGAVGTPYRDLGSPRPELGLPSGMRVLAGLHDSTANLYRYQCAGLERFTLLSTGTWIVGMSADTPADRLNERRSMGLTCDVEGRAVAGTLAMAGRDHALIAGTSPPPVTTAALDRLIARDVMLLPSLAEFDGVFPGSAALGRIVGDEPSEPGARAALATLYAALVSDVCLDLLAADATVVIDGGFAAEPAFAGLVAALRPDLRVLVSPTGDGTVRGAALLARPNVEAVAALDLTPAEPWPHSALAEYRERWRGRL